MKMKQFNWVNAPLMLSILFLAGILFSCDKEEDSPVVPQAEPHDELVKFLESTGSKAAP